MGVEWQLIRSDNKTIFDLNKLLGQEVVDVIFSQQELLEFLTLWQITICAAPFNSVYPLLLRDKLLDFVEGAKAGDLKVESDSWFDTWLYHPELIEYTTTHDRFVSEDESLDLFLMSAPPKSSPGATVLGNGSSTRCSMRQQKHWP